MRLSPIEAANEFIQCFFPNCNVAFLTGSASRGEHKASSDLDIVVIEESLNKAYRESFFKFGWRIELFIHNKESYLQFFESDRKRGRPTLPNMFASGIILKDDGTANTLKEEAQRLLDEGPDKLTLENIRASRYFLTDLLDDFIDASSFDEEVITLNTLSLQVVEFILRSNGRWIGRGKGLVRELKKYDKTLCQKFTEVLNAYYKFGEKEPLINFVDAVLEPYGGRLFDGFSMGKDIS